MDGLLNYWTDAYTCRFWLADWTYQFESYELVGLEMKAFLRVRVRVGVCVYVCHNTIFGFTWNGRGDNKPPKLGFDPTT